MYNSAGQFSTFVENFFPRGRLFRPSRRGPSAPSSVNEPASGPSAPPWPWQVGRCIWVLARGADVFSPVALASAIITFNSDFDGNLESSFYYRTFKQLSFHLELLFQSSFIFRANFAPILCSTFSRAPPS